jgi:hypothetical protein
MLKAKSNKEALAYENEEIYGLPPFIFAPEKSHALRRQTKAGRHRHVALARSKWARGQRFIRLWAARRESAFASRRVAGWPTPAAECGQENVDALLQLLINAAQFTGALHLVRRETEPGQHQEQDQPVPRLQPPFEGAPNHLRPSMQ